MISRSKVEAIMANKYSIDTLWTWTEVIKNEANEELTEWEEDFVESVRGQLQKGRELSDRQIEILERIYTQKTP